MTLTEVGDGKLQVSWATDGSGDVARPAHIHRGTCSNLEGGPVFALQPLVNDTSDTLIESELAPLLASPHAIHLHKSEIELTIYVACADIQR